MSDVRFACPFCSQHIACDRSYSGAPIDCPSCGARITVPREIAVSDREPIVAIATPAAESGELGLWTEDEWQKHLRQNPGRYSLTDSRWVLPAAPIFIAMALPVLVLFGVTPAGMWIAIIASALLSGWLMRRKVGSEAPRSQVVIAFLSGMIYYAVMAEVFLLGGCCWPTRMQEL
jgi:hypothetical protein